MKPFHQIRLDFVLLLTATISFLIIALLCMSSPGVPWTDVIAVLKHPG